MCFIKRGKFKIMKKKRCPAESRFHGNVKLNRQGLAKPNCSQINFRKIHHVWWL